MARNDWAISVGISAYFDPGLPLVEGPENDAQEFHDWVISPKGGAVRKGQAQLILSKQYKPPFATVAAAMPTAQALKLSFDHLRSIADQNEAKNLGRIVGDRLYLFFSGHGFAPSQNDGLTAMLTAEASIASQQLNHIIGSYMADFFWRAAFFKEIMLFMDCCRSIDECSQLFMPYEEERGRDYWKGIKFKAYGARVAAESRERKMADGKVHGIFTRTLMDALNGAGYDPNDPTKITAESLRDQLYNGFQSNMGEVDRERPDIPKQPEIDFEQRPGGNFTIVSGATITSFFKTAKKPEFPVQITAPGAIGKTAVIRDKTWKVLQEIQLTDKTTLSLERGLYAVQIGNGAPTMFEVTGGSEAVDVRL